MDNKKLVEAVARAIMCAETGNDECQTSEWADENWCCYEAEARAVIAVIRPAVIEECVAVVMAEGGGEQLTPMKLTLAAAIRALKEKNP